ncbi:MAG: exopolysaccharide biosynthesis polyprenyl glycosylphosphotransferase [Clostridiales bacterium]|nr:exopolysaccharide biosynthesis polyprenyl glycosylphosphotransferase [Clostridiales bacterium]
MRKYDRFLKIIKGLIPFWNIIIFCYVWALFYNGQAYAEFRLETMLISVFLYLVIYIALGKLYDAFKIGTYRITELILSQLLAFGIADLCLYLECCLMRGGVVDILPGVIAALIQLVGSIVLIVSAKHYFLQNIPPQDAILIYGSILKEQDEEQNAVASETSFEEKIRKKLPHMFQIHETVPDSLLIEELLNKIRKYNTVMLYQVEEDIRVRLLAESIQMGKNIYTTPRIEDILLTNFENRHMIDTPLLKAKSGVSEYAGKRIMDIFVSAVMLLLFSPFMLIIAAAIKIEDGGPIFFKQKRVTKGGRVFDILKFRSMRPDAEKDGARVCTVGDDRITHVGHVIRATRFDEIPQLINILKGDMSVVGPRPERVEHVEKYTEALPEFAYRLRVRGGLTGYAQIYGKYNTSAEDKLKMDLMYIERQSLLLDLQLIFLTIKIIFIPESTEGFS